MRPDNESKPSSTYYGWPFITNPRWHKFKMSASKGFPEDLACHSESETVSWLSAHSHCLNINSGMFSCAGCNFNLLAPNFCEKSNPSKYMGAPFIPVLRPSDPVNVLLRQKGSNFFSVWSDDNMRVWCSPLESRRQNICKIYGSFHQFWMCDQITMFPRQHPCFFQHSSVWHQELLLLLIFAYFLFFVVVIGLHWVLDQDWEWVGSKSISSSARSYLDNKTPLVINPCEVDKRSRRKEIWDHKSGQLTIWVNCQFGSNDYLKFSMSVLYYAQVEVESVPNHVKGIIDKITWQWVAIKKTILWRKSVILC